MLDGVRKGKWQLWVPWRLSSRATSQRGCSCHSKEKSNEMFVLYITLICAHSGVSDLRKQSPRQSRSQVHYIPPNHVAKSALDSMATAEKERPGQEVLRVSKTGFPSIVSTCHVYAPPRPRRRTCSYQSDFGSSCLLFLVTSWRSPGYTLPS